MKKQELKYAASVRTAHFSKKRYTPYNPNLQKKIKKFNSNFIIFTLGSGYNSKVISAGIDKNLEYIDNSSCFDDRKDGR